MIKCEFENGNKAHLRHVTVVVIAVNGKNEVLLVKRAQHLLRGGKWTVPGGFMDLNETTQQTALRELQEETGCNGKIKFLLRINDDPNRPKEDRQNVDFIYIVKIDSGAKTLNKEVTDIQWFSKENLPPDEKFAFDHRESILLYYKFLQKPFPLPIIGEILDRPE